MYDAFQAAKVKAAVTYNAAADHFDDAPLAFWDRIGRRTVEQLAPPTGARILDVGCGSGASALPAAAAVGAGGKVIGIDLADELLALARRKAIARGMSNVEFRYGDMSVLDFHEQSFDAVICVFAIFFVPDMERQIAALWRLVRPGGTLAITTWGPWAFEPGGSFFWESVERIRPDLSVRYNPWDRISNPDALARLLADGGAGAARITEEESVQTFAKPEDWWRVAMGSGFRWTIDQLTPNQVAACRAETQRRLRDVGASEMVTNALYTRARKDTHP